MQTVFAIDDDDDDDEGGEDKEEEEGQRRRKEAKRWCADVRRAKREIMFSSKLGQLPMDCQILVMCWRDFCERRKKKEKERDEKEYIFNLYI